MKLVIGFVVLISSLAFQTASASSLFYDKCERENSLLLQQDQPIVLVATQPGFAGMSCQQLKSTFKAAQIVGMSLMPVSMLLRRPEVRDVINADLADLGLTLANPAVLGVTVLGAFGVVTVYLVMKYSLEECERFERDQFKQEILQQLNQRYPGSNNSGVPLEIHKDGNAA